tara:strand:+ start:635 stop:883 length:249 start_codon:yes stop_codon:yes gene_type:complete
MKLENLKELFKNIPNYNFSDKGKIYISISIGWIILIGYLTWWNGLNSLSLDKSFRWDEWFWFGIIPAFAPYIFYYIWRKKDQ